MSLPTQNPEAAKSPVPVKKPEIQEGSSGEVSMVSVQMRTPEFWQDMPRMWFCRFESIMASQRQGDSVKFDLVLSKLTKEALRQVSDIVQSPPATAKYETLKERLLTVFEESAESQFQRLVNDMDLGTQKPSQLLRKMTDLAKNCGITNEPLRKLWLSRLPPSVRAVLTVSGDVSLDSLALMADKILENLGNGQVAAVASSSNAPAAIDMETEMIKHMRNMSLELKELRGEIDEIRSRGRSYGRPREREYDGGRWRFRPRSSSAPRREPRERVWLCRHHFRLREKATECEQPCGWVKGQQTRPNSEN